MQRRLHLRRNADFRRVRETGQSWAHPALVASLTPNGLTHNRYGIVTSRKLGNAVARNRAKRRIREAIRHWHPQIPSGYDMVFIARHPVLHCHYTELLAAVHVLLRRAGLLPDVES